MKEYQVVYTDSVGNEHTEVYQAKSLNEIRKFVYDQQVQGKEFQIYQLVPVHTDWAEEFEKFVKYAEENQNV